MAKVAKKGNLFLVEFIVKKINILRNALKKRPECKIGKLTVLVKFLNLPTIEIEEETKGKLVGKGEFKKGRSCLFSLPNAPPPYLLDTEFYIIRKRPDGVVPDQVTLGRTKINFSCHFINIMKMATLRPQDLPVCKALLDTYEITNIKDPSRPVGTITIIMRATCLGKLVVTQLQKQSENSILVKGSKDPTLYKCESVIRKIATAPVLRSTTKTPCGDEKDLAEEFKSLILGKKVVCNDRASFMKPDPCVSSCSGISFKSFYDESHRVCLLCDSDYSCGVPQDENVPKTESALDSGGAGVRLSKSISCLPSALRARPIFQLHAGNQTDPFTAANSRESVVEEPLKVEYLTARELGKRTCKVCSRPRHQDFDWCPAYPDAGGGERAGAGVCEAPCLPPPGAAIPAAAKEHKEPHKKERVPRTAAVGRAVVLERLKNAQRAGAGPAGRRGPHCRRQPLRHLSAARRWETGELLEPNPEPPEWSARFPPSQPYDDLTDIHIRTPCEPHKHVFVMKIQPKAKPKPRLQLELRTPRRPLPGEPPLPPPAPA